MADLEAQDQHKKYQICERCFAHVPEGSPFCKECGAPMPEGPHQEGSDSAVYPELARANLLRMRGDYKSAEAQCLGILKRYPNNVSANTLLGDIFAEEGDLQQSLQWYELALDLTPDSEAVQNKLRSIRKRLKEQEAAATAEQLGLPSERPKVIYFVLAIIAVVLLVAVVGYSIGGRAEKEAQATRSEEDDAITLPLSDPKPEGNPDEVVTSQSPIGENATNVDEDQQNLADLLFAGTAARPIVNYVMRDPRTRTMTIGYNIVEGQQPRVTGADLARIAFEKANSGSVITLRGMQEGQTMFVADVLRSRMEETLTSTWQTEHLNDPDAWIDHVLTNEWPSQNAEANNRSNEPMRELRTTQPPGVAVPGETGAIPVNPSGS